MKCTCSGGAANIDGHGDIGKKIPVLACPGEGYVVAREIWH